MSHIRIDVGNLSFGYETGKEILKDITFHASEEDSIALDPKNRRNLIRILNSFDHLKIIASHDLDMILDTCERTILMADGRIVADGKTEEILTNKELLEEHSLELPLYLQRR